MFLQIARRDYIPEGFLAQSGGVLLRSTMILATPIEDLASDAYSMGVYGIVIDALSSTLAGSTLQCFERSIVWNVRSAPLQTDRVALVVLHYVFNVFLSRHVRASFVPGPLSCLSLSLSLSNFMCRLINGMAVVLCEARQTAMRS